MYDNNTNTIFTKIRSRYRRLLSVTANQNGQILLFTILVSLVALTVAIAATRRTTVDIRRVETTTEADRAFSAAEAGIEEKLFEIKDGTPVPGSCTTCGLDFGTSNVKEIDVSPENSLTLSELARDTSVSVHLVEDIHNPTSAFDGQLQVTWDRQRALVLTLVYKTTSGSYSVNRLAWRCGPIVGNTFPQVSPTIDSGAKCATTFNIGSLRPSSTDIPIMVRIRAMYGNTSLAISPATGTLPRQIVSITSTGQAGEAERTVQARRTHTTLPVVFDFALFNASSNRVITASTTPGIRWFEVIAGQVHSNYSGTNDFSMTIPSGQYFCKGLVGCVISTQGTINFPAALTHAVSNRRWRAPNYSGGIDISRYSYNSLWSRVQSDVNAAGATFASVSGTLSSGGIVRVSPTSGNEIVLDENAWNLFGSNAVVVFVGGEGTGSPIDLIVDANTPPYNFVGKNVMFIVSGAVEIRSSVYTFEAAVIANGKIKVSSNP